MDQVPTDNSQAANQAQSTTQVQTPQPTSRAETSQPTSVMSPEPTKKSNLKPLVLVLILGLLAGGVGISYTFIKNKGGRQDGQQDVSSGPTTSESRLGKSISDNFDASFLNEEVWYPWKLSETSRVEQIGGVIQVEISPGFTEDTSAGLDLLPLVEADFEVQVDAAILSGGDPGGSETALVFRNDIGEPINQIAIFLRKEEDGIYIRVARELNGNYENLDFAKSYDYAGPFTIKMSRKDGKVTFNVKPKESTSFETIGQLSSEFYQGRGRITLHLNSYGDNFPAVVSTFDNFSLKVQ